MDVCGRSTVLFYFGWKPVALAPWKWPKTLLNVSSMWQSEMGCGQGTLEQCSPLFLMRIQILDGALLNKNSDTRWMWYEFLLNRCIPVSFFFSSKRECPCHFSLFKEGCSYEGVLLKERCPCEAVPFREGCHGFFFLLKKGYPKRWDYSFWKRGIPARVFIL